jgi:hypothetical protein
MRLVRVATAALPLFGAAPSPPPPPPVWAPAKPGTCAFTTVKSVGQRLQDESTGREIPDSGSAVELANGVPGVSYDQVAAVNESKPGDPVMVCLVRLPRNCPPGDRRGRVYTATNLRTMHAWTLPDAQHACGGA